MAPDVIRDVLMALLPVICKRNDIHSLLLLSSVYAMIYTHCCCVLSVTLSAAGAQPAHGAEVIRDVLKGVLPVICKQPTLYVQRRGHGIFSSVHARHILNAGACCPA
jgi:uncharacterized membrane protein YeiH